MATDRARLTRVPGLRFWRLLGTGHGARTSFSVDPSRSAVFAVWEEPAVLEELLATSALARRWQRAGKCWTVRLALLGGHGRWRGADVLSGLQRVEPGGPVAVLTRAEVRVRAWRRFRAAGFGVSDAAIAAPGMRAVVGIGEAPLGKQTTFSVWSDAAALRAFAYADPRTSRWCAAPGTRAGTAKNSSPGSPRLAPQAAGMGVTRWPTRISVSRRH